MEGLKPIVPVTMITEEGRRSPALERAMTETKDVDAITEALAVIDRGLGDMLHRELVSTDEVADLLLDVRTLLAATGDPADAVAAN